MVLSTENKKNKLIKTHPNKKYKLDNVYTHIFTPRSFLVDIADLAEHKNIVACLSSDVGLNFLYITVSKQLAYTLNTDISNEIAGKFMKILFVLESEETICNITKLFHLHSEFKVLELDNDLSNFHSSFPSSNIIIATFDSCIKLLQNFHYLKRFFSLLVIPNCHKAFYDFQFETVVDFFYGTHDDNNHVSAEVHSNTKLPRILATTSSLLADQHLHPLQLEANFKGLEKLFRAEVIVAPGLIPLPVLTDNNLLLKQQQLKQQKIELQNSAEDHPLNGFDENDFDADTDDSYNTTGTLYHSKLITTQLTHPQEQVINCPASTDHTGLVKKIDKFIKFTLHFVRTFDYANLEYLDKVLSKSDSDGKPTSKEIVDGSADANDCDDKNELKSSNDTELDQKDPAFEKENIKKLDTQNVADGLKNLEIGNEDETRDKNHATDRPKSPNNHQATTKAQQTTTQQASNEAPKKDLLQSVNRCLVECLDILHQLGPWCSAKVAHAFVKQLNKMETCEPNKGVVQMLQLAASTLRCVDKMVEDYFESNVHTLDDFLTLTTPKVTHLLQILRKYKPDDNFTIVPGNYDDDGDDVEDDDLRKNGDEDDEEEEDDDDKVMSQVGWSRAGKVGGQGVSCVVVKKEDGVFKSLQEEEGIWGLVFVDRKHVAFALNKLLVELCNWDVDLYFVWSHYVAPRCISEESRGEENKGSQVSNDTQRLEEVLKKFRRRELNLLFTTPALETGIELPRCNLIVRFSLPTTYTSYIHSKARARSLAGKYIHLVDAPMVPHYHKMLQSFQHIQEILFKRCRYHQQIYLPLHMKSKVSDEDEDEEAVKSNDKSDTSKISMEDAIKLINRYCVKLPSDTFTHLTAICKVEEVDEGGVVGDLKKKGSLFDGSVKYKASLRLPVSSSVKQTIVGPLMRNEQDAKRAVALEMCKLLHQSKELDDNYQPIGKEDGDNEDDDDDDDSSEEYGDEEVSDQLRPGSTKRKQHYVKSIAHFLKAPPSLTQPNYLYVFHMTLTGPITDEQNTRGRPINAPEDTSKNLGFITFNKLPLIPLFPVFTRSGEVTVGVDLVSSSLSLSPLQLQRLLGFHRFIFCQVLRLEKHPMAFDSSTSPWNSLLVPVDLDPTTGVETIDWDFITKIETYPPPTFANNHRSFSFKYNNKSTGKSPNGVDSSNHTAQTSEEAGLNGWGEIKDQTNKKWLMSDEDVIHNIDANNAVSIPSTVNQAKTKQNTAPKATGQASKGTKPSKKGSFTFDEELFKDAVVTPSYRNVDQPQYFYVAEIRKDLSLLSTFPSPELYDTFKHYYNSKYNLHPTNDHQPLLDVDHTSARLNLLTPRYVNQKGISLPTSSAENRRIKRESLQQKQILVPEFCYVHPLPASFWRKVVCVPTMLYRLNHLLLAEELRTTVMAEADLGFKNDAQVDETNGVSHSEVVRPCLQFRFAIDGQTTSTLTLSRKTGVASNTSDGSNYEEDEEEDEKEDGNNDKKPPIEESCRDHSVSKINDNTHTQQFGASSSSLDDDYDSNGPTSCDIIQTLTMSNANDFFNLERLETVGDSFLKFAVTVYLYCNNLNIHEGRLSYLRSLQVSNQNLYKLGKRKNLPGVMVAVKFEPVENWLPPGFVLKMTQLGNSLYWQNPKKSIKKQEIKILEEEKRGEVKKEEKEEKENEEDEKIMEEKDKEKQMKEHKEKKTVRFNDTNEIKEENIKENKEESIEENKEEIIKENKEKNETIKTNEETEVKKSNKKRRKNKKKSDNTESTHETSDDPSKDTTIEINEASKVTNDALDAHHYVPYNLQTQHSIPDKSIADCVEAIIGCYLACAGQTSALKLMNWFGLKVLPVSSETGEDKKSEDSTTNSTSNHPTTHSSPPCTHLTPPPSPLLCHVDNPHQQLEHLLQGFDQLEDMIGYHFRDKAYLLQAFTHASFYHNTITDCYQRLEFLGDAILDYIITRHLFEDSIEHSPGILTDLRSALVNNNIFAYLAVKWSLHKYIKYVSSSLFDVINKFVEWVSCTDEEALINDAIEGDWFLNKNDQPITEDSLEKDNHPNKEDSFQKRNEDGRVEDGKVGAVKVEGAEEDSDVEMPKILGDVFESLAGAIYLDSGFSLDRVWTVYRRLMERHISAFLLKIPKSPVRELLEMEPETAKFEKPERTIDGRVRVVVNVLGKGSFKGVGRNYRIAKTSAAKKALKCIKEMTFCTSMSL